MTNDRAVMGGARVGEHRVDPAVRKEALLGRPPDHVFQPDGLQELERPELEVTGARMDRGAGVALDRERGDVEMGEEHGGREPDQAAAHDQDGYLLPGAPGPSALRVAVPEQRGHEGGTHAMGRGTVRQDGGPPPSYNRRRGVHAEAGPDRGRRRT